MGITTNGLIVYLPLYSTDLQGTGITSKDTNQYSCSVVGATWGTTGRAFNGTDQRIIIPRATSLEPASAISYGAWVKPSAIDDVGVIDKPNTSHTAPYYSYEVEITASKAIMNVAASGIYNDLTSSASIPVDKWTFIFCTYDGATQKIYINGAEDISESKTGTISYYTTDLRIGELQNVANYDFSGTIGEVFIYSRALTAAEISDLHTETVKTYKACYGFATWK